MALRGIIQILDFSRLVSHLSEEHQSIVESIVKKLVKLEGLECQSCVQTLDCEQTPLTVTFTDTELTVFNYMAQGYTNKQIAFELHYSEAAIKRVVTRILREIKVNSRTQAVVTGIKWGILPCPVRRENAGPLPQKGQVREVEDTNRAVKEAEALVKG